MGEGKEGFTQGDPEATPFYCVTWHEDICRAEDLLKPVGGAARFLSDDGYLVGPRREVFASFKALKQDLMDKCGLRLQVTKCELLCRNLVLPDDCPEGVSLGGVLVDGQFKPGFLVVGVPVGSDKYVRHMMDKKVEGIEDEVRKSIDLLRAEKHALWTLLRASTLHKLEYWLGTVHPSLKTRVAEWMDGLLHKMLESSAGASIPQGALPRLPGAGQWQGYEAVLEVPVEGLGDRSYQWWVSQIPVRLGGLGVRLQSSLLRMSYLGTVEKVLPSFSSSNLSHLYKEGEPDHRQWSSLVNSGSRLGREFTLAWNAVRREASQCCNFLGEEMPEIFTPSAEGFGLGAVEGSRQKMVEGREMLLAATLSKGLSQLADQGAMAVTSWKNRDKISTAFLLELPGPHDVWSSAEWIEALCLLLSLHLVHAQVREISVKLLGTDTSTSMERRCFARFCQGGAGCGVMIG